MDQTDIEATGQRQQQVTGVKGLIEFADKTRRFKTLPSPLKDIAINTALKVLQIEDGNLIYRAGEIDVLAMTDEFAHTEQSANGALIKNHTKMHEYLLRRYSYDEATRIGLAKFRQSIASRISRLELAKHLRYQPGQYASFVLRPDFQAANDFCWQAVREFQAYKS